MDDSAIGTCKRCGNQFPSKQALKQHLQRKNPCHSVISTISIEEHMKDFEKTYKQNAICCTFCKQMFNSSSNMYTHRKTCISNPSSPMYHPREASNNGIENEIIALKSKVVLLEREVFALKAFQIDVMTQLQQVCRNKTEMPSNELDNQKFDISNISIHDQQTFNTSNTSNTSNTTTSNSSNSNNVTTNTTHINCPTINITNFGSETTDHLSPEFIKKCLMDRFRGMEALIEKIHFDENVPENNNIRLRNVKEKIVEISESNKWNPKTKNFATDTMIRNGSTIARSYYEGDDELKKTDEERLHYAIILFLNEIQTQRSPDFYELRSRIWALIMKYPHNKVMNI
jgi:hypothetical protein